MGSVTILDRSGDSTLAWSDDNDARVREVIAKKMKEGWSFFLLKPRVGGLVRPKRTDLKKIKDLPEEARAISMSDPDFMKLIEEGFAGIGKSQGKLETSGRAKSAEEAASRDSVAVQPRRGG